MKKILLIEDDPSIRQNLALMLKLEGFAVSAAADGREGVRLAESAKPDLIVCDVMMPGLDGHGVIAALRAKPALAATPFLFLTARGAKTDVRNGMDLGADDYLVKPVGAEELLRAIRSRLARHEQIARAGAEPDFNNLAPLHALGLTPREAEVLSWLAQGKSNPEIAVILAMSEGTVKKHLEHVFEKLGVDNRNAAALVARENLARR